MSARPKETHAIQVFPFLAVLVCTMGALIFLLLLMTRQVRTRELALISQHQAQRALARAEAKRAREAAAESQKPPEVTTIVIPAQPVKEHQKPVKLPDQSHLLALAERERELDELTTKWKLKTEKLESEREKARNSLLRNKALINAALTHAKAVKSEVEKLEGQLEQTSAEAAELPTSTAQEAEQLAVEQQIAEMKRRLRAAQVADANGSNDQFQVIPFDPQSGTTRRPILIECSEAGIRFLPEDITITSADFNGFTPRVNPLAAGTAALINYWNERNAKQRNSKAEPEPYPLLLVRPDGVVAYYVAMRMLEPIRTIHGYELIEGSTVLKLPEADPKAKAACQAAVERMLAERENVQRVALNSGNGGSVYGGLPRRVSSSGGGGKRGGGGNESEDGPGGGSGPAGKGAVGDGAGAGRTGGSSSAGAGRGSTRGSNSRGVGSTPGDGDGIASNGRGDVGSGDERGEGSVLDGNATFGRKGKGRPAGQTGFTLSDLDPEEERVGSRSWERIENFEGRQRQRKGDEIADIQGDSPQGSGSGLGQRKVRGTSAKRPSGTTGTAGTGVGGGDDSSNPDGLDSNSASADSVGTNSSESKTFGMAAAGANSSGTNSSGLNSSANNSSGNNSSGNNSSGNNSSGNNSSGNNSTSNNSTSNNSTGANASGTDASSDNSAGANPSGKNSSRGNASNGNASGAGNSSAGGGQSGGSQSGGSQSGNASNGSTSSNANASNGQSEVPTRNQARWTSPGVPQKPAPPTDESGNVGSYGQAEPGMPIGRRPGSKASTSNQGGGDGSDGSESGDAASGQNGVQPIFGLGGRSNRYGSSDDAPPRKSRGPRLSPDSSRPSGKRSKSDDSEKQLEPEMLAGRHWGYADAGASIGFERDVRVDVSADKLVIAERYEIPVGQGETKQETFELFVTLLDRHSHEWGRPPQGFFWTPRLKFVVKPEGSMLYEQVNTMMTRAGVSTSHEFAKTKDNMEYGRDSISKQKSTQKTTRKPSSGDTQ